MDRPEHPDTPTAARVEVGIEDVSRHERGSGEVGGVTADNYPGWGDRGRDMTIVVNLLCPSSIVTCKSVYIFLEQI